MKFYNRNGILWVRINGVRKSTKLKDTPANRKLFTSYSKNDEFFKKFDLVKKEASTVVQLCEEVLIEKESIIKSSSLKAYKSLFESKIIPYFEKKFIKDIKPVDVKNFYKTFDDRSTLTTCLAILKPAFEIAILNEEIKTNPINEVSKIKISASEYAANPFNLDEMKLILSNADGSLKNILGILFFTGLRIGELCALKWDDVDFKNMQLDINATMSRGVVGVPKTDSSKAVIDLPVESLPFFQSQRKSTGLRKYVIYSERGKPYMYPTVISNNFHKLLDQLKLEKRSLHQTRHTFASLKLSYGERLEWVSYMLRHKSPTITLDVYYKYIPRANEKRVVFDLNDLAQKRHS